MEILSRKEFLAKGLKAAVFLAVIEPFKKCFGNSIIQDQYPEWKELVEIARWCPTVHNLQPHKLKIISDTEAELYYDPKRLLPVGDPHSVFTTIAMGIFIEHLSIVAAQYGCEVRIKELARPITTSAKDLTLFATLSMHPRTKPETLNFNLIKKRRTARECYNGKPMSPESLMGVEQIAREYGHDFFSTHEKETIDVIVKLNQETLFDDLNSKANRQELNGLFRYNEKEAQKNKDGLWSRCMGFPGKLMKRVFTHHESWTHGLKRNLLAKYYKSSFQGTKTIAWFGGSFNNTNDWLNCGKMLARNWLFITSQGAYIQPFGSLITNPEAYKKINGKFPQPSKGKSIWMIFRVGYCKEPTRSYRLNTNEIIF